MSKGLDIGFRLARKQVKAGHPVWMPPEDFAVLLRDILTRFCDLDEKRANTFEADARAQKITKAYQLPELSTEILQRHFDLSVGEALEFRRVARWIRVMQRMKEKE